MIPMDADGKCSVCDSSAGNDFVSCFLCRRKFHAHGCTLPKDSNICTSSFLQLFRPLSEKTGVNTSRPGNFLFACDPCMTQFETDQALKMEDKFEMLKNQIKVLSEDIKAMKSTSKWEDGDVLKKPASFAKVLSPPNDASEKVISNPAGFSGSSSSVNVAIADISTTQPAKSSVLVIDEFENVESEKQQLDRVEQVVLANNISIKDSYKNKHGKTVIVCNSDKQRNLLKSHIANTLPSLSVKVPNQLSKTITVAGFDPKYNDNIIKTLTAQNNYVADFLKLNSSENESTSDADNHIKVLFVKPLKNNLLLSQVVFKVSPRFRELIKYHGDKVLVGMKGCPVYDRFFVKRCFCCQKYGHIQSKCPTPSNKVCSNCSGNHDTKNCDNNGSPSCANCKHEGLDSSHHASSTKCPIFQRGLDKVRNATL